MGGWSVLAAAKAAPDDYKAIVLNGSSTGRPFAADGTPTWPRNLALVYARYDEFARFFWGSPDARKVTTSKKLWDVFGQSTELVPGRVYGSIDQGTARVLFTPSETHPLNHLSRETVGHAIDWFGRTLSGGKPIPASDQIWLWKEIGTLVALIGFVVLLLGTFDALLGMTWFSGLARAPPRSDAKIAPARRWLVFAATTLVPAITFFPLLALGDWLLPASAVLPQGVTNQFMVWALANALVGLMLALLLPRSKPAVRASDRARHRDCAAHRRHRIRLAPGGRCAVQDRLPVLDRRPQTDERGASRCLLDLSPPVHGVLPGGVSRPLSHVYAAGRFRIAPVCRQCARARPRHGFARRHRIRRAVRDRRALSPDRDTDRSAGNRYSQFSLFPCSSRSRSSARSPIAGPAATCRVRWFPGC